MKERTYLSKARIKAHYPEVKLYKMILKLYLSQRKKSCWLDNWSDGWSDNWNDYSWSDYGHIDWSNWSDRKWYNWSNGWQDQNKECRFLFDTKDGLLKTVRYFIRKIRKIYVHQNSSNIQELGGLESILV